MHSELRSCSSALATSRRLIPSVSLVTTNDCSCLCFVIELLLPRVPKSVGVHPLSGRGLELRLNATAFWPREQQYDENGAWIPFYGSPPPPPPPAAFHPPTSSATCHRSWAHRLRPSTRRSSARRRLLRLRHLQLCLSRVSTPRRSWERPSCASASSTRSRSYCLLCL
jgi:hypothetical protein